MNGVFGPGGKLKFSQSTPQAAQPKPEKPEKTQDSLLPDMERSPARAQQKKLDEMLKKQNAALRGAETPPQSRRWPRQPEDAARIWRPTACWPRARQTRNQEHLGSFEGLAAEVKKTVLGQDAFVEGVARAMRRPFVLGTEPPAARNVGAALRRARAPGGTLP